MRRALVLVVGVMVLWGVYGWSAEPQLYDAIAAIVEGKVVSVREVVERMELSGLARSFPTGKKRSPAVRAAYRQALDSIIDDLLIDMEVKKAKIQVGDDEVEAYVRRIMAANKITELEKFKAAVEAQGMSWNQFWEMKRKQIARQRFLSFKVGRDAKVEDSEVQAEYQRRKQAAEKTIVCTIVYAVVRSPSVELARQAAQWLAQNSSPDRLQQDAASLESNLNSNAQDPSLQVSIRVYSATHEFNEWIEPFQRVCAETQEGSMSSTVVDLGKQGIAAAGLVERKHKQYPPYEQVRREILLELYSKRFERLTRRYLDELRKKSVIKIFPIETQTIESMLGLR